MSEDDRIAIVGLACRVPGSPDAFAFWRNLCAGVAGVRRFTPAEVAAAGVPPEVAADRGYVPAFGHLDGLEDFDAALFGYADAEAALLDPQHRIFLELAWWALEDAGHDPARTRAQVGVFAGCGVNRYLRHHLLGNPAVRPPGGLAEDWDAEDWDAGDWDDALAGGTSDYLPARVAYALGLTGPAVAVQTACSSSLVAVCQAAQSLLDYRCDVAVAGGAAVVSTRQAGYRYRPGGTLSADGFCRPYDAGATGQVFGNGGGAVVLKRLPDAIADGDHVHAVLAGMAVNNDGADRAGFTVPGVNGQAAVIAEALAAAEWDPTGVGFVEGHGSGTPVGDAIEVDALTRAFRAGSGRAATHRSDVDGHRWVLGSVKSTVGNLDAAAGVVSLIKAALAVREGVIPPTLHFVRPHPDVDLAGGPFAVNAAAYDWAGPRRAGVSSFGLGGTNAHVLVEQPPPPAAPPAAPDWSVLPLCAGDPGALRDLARRLASHLADVPAVSVADAGHTLAVGRRALPCRAAVACRDAKDAIAGLIAVAQGDAAPLPAGVPDELRDRAGAWLAGGAAPVAPGRRIPLPGYPFQRRRHWIEPPVGGRP